ncbi:MAG: homoserine O-acetyltransferase [Clostridiales Family XIII bacterium]|jgi:homoserine O-acetyltransferase|nr:homoserine O-acetyltransferase [Clostridiales Family XIII bacterium]
MGTITNMNHIEKKSFKLAEYTLDCGVTIPVELGYETYGTLNEDKSNVILVSHYFSASSHAAGRYTPEDALPGYWDAIIGPEKAVDTNRYFVISTDNLANVQSNHPSIITTGPRSINPTTGKRWGLDFPQYTFRDQAGIQKKFLNEQLGIDHLYAVMGASAGGFISLEWAVSYPDSITKLIGVITNPQNPVLTSFSVLQHAMRAIALDSKWQDGQYEDDCRPDDGLRLAVQMMNVGAFTADFYEQTYPRNTADDVPYTQINAKASYENILADAINLNIPLIDPSHWYYTCKATMIHDIARGYGSLEQALDRITADTLMISSVTDYLQPTRYNVNMVDYMKSQGKNVELYTIDSNKGHMAGVLDGHLFADKLKAFLQ